MVDLVNEIGVIRDKGAKSLSYFCTQQAVEITDDIINQLLTVSAQHGRSDARLSLHTTPDDSFHEMIILQYKGHYFRPHLHRNKGESCHIIRGKVVFVLFNDDGSIAESCVVGDNHGLIFRSGPDIWHVVIPISEYAVYHESKPGPYLNHNDSLFPSWAPDGSIRKESIEYMENLLSSVDEFTS